MVPNMTAQNFILVNKALNLKHEFYYLEFLKYLQIIAYQRITGTPESEAANYRVSLYINKLKINKLYKV